MKNILFAWLSSLLALFAQAQNIPAPPNPPRLVNDFAGALSAGEAAALEQKLVQYNDSTSTQFAIVIVNSYGEYDPAEYTFELGNRWGIGQKGKNNGLLITVAVQDRKYFIATGYGLEGSIPDAIANRIGDQYFRPNFRAGNYYHGLDEATTYLAQLPADEFKAARRNQGREKDGGSGIFIFLLILFLIFILPAIFRGRRNNRRGGGGLGGGMFFPPFITFGSGGSSGSWGGGGGGGGFGGFGGGSFGGGGAGGDW